jgi:hypothetical protein
MKEKQKEQKLFFISVLFLMLFSFPFIKMANKEVFIAGFPLFYLYLFFVWFLAIIISLLIADSKKRPPKQRNNE